MCAPWLDRWSFLTHPNKWVAKKKKKDVLESTGDILNMDHILGNIIVSLLIFYNYITVM